MSNLQANFLVARWCHIDPEASIFYEETQRRPFPLQIGIESKGEFPSTQSFQPQGEIKFENNFFFSSEESNASNPSNHKKIEEKEHNKENLSGEIPKSVQEPENCMKKNIENREPNKNIKNYKDGTKTPFLEQKEHKTSANRLEEAKRSINAITKHLIEFIKSSQKDISLDVDKKEDLKTLKDYLKRYKKKKNAKKVSKKKEKFHNHFVSIPAQMSFNCFQNIILKQNYMPENTTSFCLLMNRNPKDVPLTNKQEKPLANQNFINKARKLKKLQNFKLLHLQKLHDLNNLQNSQNKFGHLRNSNQKSEHHKGREYFNTPKRTSKIHNFPLVKLKRIANIDQYRREISKNNGFQNWKDCCSTCHFTPKPKRISYHSKGALKKKSALSSLRPLAEFMSIHKQNSEGRKSKPLNHSKRPYRMRRKPDDHTDQLERTLPCPYCDKKFKRNAHVVSHMRTHLPKKKMYKCQFCKAVFSFKSGKRRHEKTHTGESIVYCEICGKRFYRTHRLNVHRIKFHPETLK